jgi:hypothetical protein
MPRRSFGGLIFVSGTVSIDEHGVPSAAGDMARQVRKRLR